MPLGYQTFYHSRHGLNNGPFVDWTVLDHLNTELVHSADPHWIEDPLCTTRAHGRMTSYRLTHWWRPLASACEWSVHLPQPDQVLEERMDCPWIRLSGPGTKNKTNQMEDQVTILSKVCTLNPWYTTFLCLDKSVLHYVSCIAKHSKPWICEFFFCFTSKIITHPLFGVSYIESMPHLICILSVKRTTLRVECSLVWLAFTHSMTSIQMLSALKTG